MRTKKAKILVVFIFSIIFLVIFYLALLGFYSIKAFKEVNQKNWQSASNYGQRIVLLTNWTKLLCGECSQSNNLALLTIVTIRRGGEILSELENFLATSRLFFQAAIQDKPNIVYSQWPNFQDNALNLLTKIESFQLLAYKIKLPSISRWLGQEKSWQRIDILLKTIHENHDQFKEGLRQIPTLTALYGLQKNTYIILLQNDKELRPTGGFLGSYAQLWFDHGCLKDYVVQDIYVPDGAIKGHIEPPEPIQKAFQHGTWRLPNSNWDPDFPSAAKTISWFLDKGGIKESENIIAVNFQVLQDIFKVIGEIYIPDYQTSISSANLYLVTQYKVEHNFFPGSTQKKDFLYQLTKNLILQSQQITLEQLGAIAALVYRHAQQRNIQFYFKDPTLQQLITDLGWSGRLEWSHLADQFQDYVFIVDANLSANKANCCVQREVIQTIQPKGDVFEIQLKIEYLNLGQSPGPEPPEYWGGDYKNYLRVLLPEKAKIQSVNVGGQTLTDESITVESEPEQKVQSVGFFVAVPHSQRTKVELNYILPKQKGQKDYQLFIQKQSGINYWHTVEYRSADGIKQTKQWIENDQRVGF